MTNHPFFGIVSVWNNQETVYECLQSLTKVCDIVFVLEGKWKGYKGELRSTDNTKEEIRRLLREGHRIAYAEAPKEQHQFEARNQLLGCVPDGCFMINLDSDEILEKYPSQERLQELINEWLKNSSKGACIYHYDAVEGDTKTGHLMDLPKIIFKSRGLHYTKNHRYLDDNNGKIVYNWRDFPACEDFLFVHKSMSKATRPQADAYKEWLLKWENKNR